MLLENKNYKIYKVQYIPLGHNKFIDVGFPNHLLPFQGKFYKFSIENTYLTKNYYKLGGEPGYFNKKVAFNVFKRIVKYNPTMKLRILKVVFNLKCEEIIRT